MSRRSAPPAVPPTPPARLPIPATALAAAAILTAGCAAYSLSFHGVMFFDDDSGIVNNPQVKDVSWLWRSDGPKAPIVLAGRPLVTLSFALNHALGGLEPAGYHAVNLALHLGSALLLFGLLRLGLKRADPDASCGPPATLAAAVALLWTVHPLNSEAVMYLMQRTELLMAFFYLLTLYCAARAWDSPRAALWQAGAVAAGFAGMASKEVMVSAPVAVVLFDLCVRGAGLREAFARRWPLYAGLAASWGLLAYLMLSRPPNPTITLEGHMSPLQYLLTQSRVLTMYVKLCFWPAPLTVAYPTAAAAPGEAAPAMLLWTALFAATVWALFRRPAVGFTALMFFLILGPTSSVVPILSEIAAERRMYLPSAVVLLLAAAGAVRVMRPPTPVENRVLAGLGLTAILTLVLATITLVRSAQYFSRLLIWEDAVAKSPRSLHAQTNYGQAALKEGLGEEAVRAFRAALEISPTSGKNQRNLGVALMDLGRLDEAEAPLREAVRLEPETHESHVSLGNWYRRRGKLPEAAAEYREAIRLKGDYYQSHNNLGTALEQLGDLAGAAAAYREALRLEPHDPAVLNNLALLLSAAPDPAVRDGAAAIEMAKTAVVITDGLEPMMINTLAAAFAETGDFAKAVEFADEAAEMAARMGRGSAAQAYRRCAELYRAGKPLRRMPGVPVPPPAASPDRPATP